LSRLREDLRRRHASPVFDVSRFAAGLEAAYARMWQTWRAGARPESFTIEPS
jgi:hypothetical protein